MHSKIRQSSLLSALDTSSAIKHLSRFLVFLVFFFFFVLLGFHLPVRGNTGTMKN